MYIVTSLELVQAIQKQAKSLAFPPIEAKFASKICGVSAEAHKVLLNNVNGDEGDWGLSMESYAAIRSALLSGPGLDEMNRVMIQSIAASLDSLQVSVDKPKLKLAKWLRSNVTIATTNSIYGPQNPFKDDSVADAFWYVTRACLKLASLTIDLGNLKAKSWPSLWAFSHLLWLVKGLQVAPK